MSCHYLLHDPGGGGGGGGECMNILIQRFSDSIIMYPNSHKKTVQHYYTLL